MNRRLLLALTLLSSAVSLCGAEPPAKDIYARENLLAWCIVPFDAKKRGPEERAEMLERLGIKGLAYDWRDEHIPQFDSEVEAMKKRGIAIKAWWCPGALNDQSKKILDVAKRHNLHLQLWVMANPSGATQDEKVSNAAKSLTPLADAAAEIGCDVALYNHGGWFGEPENQAAIVKAMNKKNVGIVYNFHHGHAHIANFKDRLAAMQPYLIAVNLNGMRIDGDKTGKKILSLGLGDQEAAMMKTIRDSGWKGPVGLICHRTDADAEVVLKENLAGLDKVLSELNK